MSARSSLRTATLALTAGALTLTGALVAGTPASANDSRTTVLRTALTGAQEVPGPGDPDGSGRGQLRIKVATGEICYRLRVRDIETATVAHIHEAVRGKAAPPVASLLAPLSGRSDGCFVNPPLARDIVADPADYYLNVHNVRFPAGAVRGQLG